MKTIDRTTTNKAMKWHRKQMILAGGFTLMGLFLALLYELHSTPYTMSGFLMGSPLFVFLAMGFYVRSYLRQNQESKAKLAPLKFEAGETIFHQGDEADCIYLITEGHVEVIYHDPKHGKITLGKLGPHEYFGEGAAFNQGRRQADAVAVTAAQMVVMARSDFHILYANLPNFRENLRTNLGARQTLLESVRDAERMSQ